MGWALPWGDHDRSGSWRSYPPHSKTPRRTPRFRLPIAPLGVTSTVKRPPVLTTSLPLPNILLSRRRRASCLDQPGEKLSAHDRRLWRGVFPITTLKGRLARIL